MASHINPDGDAIGSLLAMGLFLRSLNKNITLYNETPIPAVYRFLPRVELIVQELDENTAYDMAVVLDCGDISRIGSRVAFFKSIGCVVNIDHHVTNKRFGHYYYVDPRACATCEIIHRFIKFRNEPISKEIANAIYTGIFTDTGSFRFSNTTRSAFTICEEMVSAGVDPFTVAQHVYGKYSLGRIKLLNLALNSIETSKDGTVSMMTVTQGMLKKTGTQPEDADGMINYARRIADVKVAIMIQEQLNGFEETNEKLYHVSLRSDGSVDVSKIAGFYGGGGHKSAAGFSIKSDLTILKNRMIQLAETI